MSAERKHVCILAFSVIKRDARVLRQVEYLSPHYDVTVIGYGERPAGWDNAVQWRQVTPKTSTLNRILNLLTLIVGRIWPRIYVRRYTTRGHVQQATAFAQQSNADLYHANDWDTLPIAAEVAAKTGAKLVFDAHEFAPLQNNTWFFTHLVRYRIIYFIKRYAGQAARTITVSEPIAERYTREYHFHPTVIMNIPSYRGEVSKQPVDPANIRLIHHGGAQPKRQLELLIDSVAKADAQFTLHFMLVGDAKYIQFLKDHAQKMAPGRVHFHEGVPPEQIVQTIADYDIGIHLLPPSNYNHLMALPNKLFDFIHAGLAVVIGPSPAMQHIVETYKLGAVTSDFTAEAFAEAINALDVETIQQMQQAAITATNDLNADIEMGKLVQIYADLLQE